MAATTPPSAPTIADPTRKIVVAIDGPAASGKSSTAQWVAEKLGFRHVDSGALYRAVTAARLRAGGSPDEWSEASVLAVARQVSLRPTEQGFIPLIRGEPADGEIRGGEVTREVSRTARMQAVRDWVNGEVRRVAAGHDVVVDGRDIGTAVFPDAQVKIFLVADPWERAKRRLIQRLSRRPTDAEIAEETERLVQRDARDSTQTVQARDAILIDTTYLTQADQVERIVALAKGVARRG
jgi:cytidylate kinase